MQDDLKTREIDILRLMAEGLTNREIADRLYIGVETVRWYAKQIYSKFNVAGREEAVAKATALGLLDADIEQTHEAPRPKPKHNFPTQLTTFIGREQPIAEVTDLLAATRLLTLTGPGGTGKTRLALKVAERMLDAFSDGVCFVDLAPLSEPGLITSAIVRTLGIFESGDQSLMEALKRALGQRKMLLILDNYEHLISAGSVVTELLASAPNIKILVTSREDLRVKGEHIYTMPPMLLPESTTDDPDVVEATESVALFVQQAQAVKTNFRLKSSDIEDIVAICRRLDGMPLAIELAAAQSRFLTPDAILKRRKNRFQSLRGGTRDAPARQQTLSNAIDWSINLLSPDEKLLFARLSVFRGGRSLEAIEAVCAEDLPMDVFDGLAALVDKSMIRQLEDQLGEPRFVMLETLQEYALERLSESGEAETLRQRHARYFADFAQRAEPHLETARQQEWYSRLETELDNLRAALSWSLAGAAPELGCQILHDMIYFWWTQGHHVEWQRWVDHALEYSADLTTLMRGRLFIDASSVAYFVLRDYRRCETFAAQAEAIFQELGEDYSLARARILHTSGQFGQGHDYSSLLKSMDSAAAILRQLNQLPMLAINLNMRGEIAKVYEDYDQAELSYLESLKICRGIGNRRRECIMLENLGQMAIYREAYGQAEAYLKASHWLMVELDFINYLSAGHPVDYATLWLETGRPVQAAQLLGASAALQESIGVYLELPDQRVYDRTMNRLRAQLGNDAFQIAWEAKVCIPPCNATRQRTVPGKLQALTEDVASHKHSTS